MTPAPLPAFTYRAVIDRWVDGDTLIVAIDLGFAIWSHQIVRMMHINAPEMKTRKGPKALAAMVERAPVGSRIMIRTHLDHSDNWHRILADLWTPNDQAETLNEWALANGWAEPWPKPKQKATQ